MALICLSRTSSQIRIRASNAKTLAITAWNSMWYGILLSALFDCEIGFNIQCNTNAEEFSQKSTIHITNYHLYGLQEPYRLTESDVKWLKSNIAIAKKLLDNEKFNMAVHAMATYRWHLVSRAQLAIIWFGIEALFDIKTDLTSRISLCIAKTLENNNENTIEEITKNVKKLYRARSSAVHGEKIAGDECELVTKSANLLKTLIVRCIEKKDLPNISES